MTSKSIGSGTSGKAILYYITDYTYNTALKAYVAYVVLKAAKEKLQINLLSGSLPKVKYHTLLAHSRVLCIQELQG